LLDGKIRDEFKNVKFQYDRGYKNNSIKLLIPAIGNLVKKLMFNDSNKIKNKGKFVSSNFCTIINSGNFQTATKTQPSNRKSQGKT